MGSRRLPWPELVEGSLRRWGVVEDYHRQAGMALLLCELRCQEGSLFAMKVNTGTNRLACAESRLAASCVSRREFMSLMGGVGASVALPTLALSAAQARARRRPNVVLILTDDQGYGDLGCHGNDKIKTPNLDRLCAEGVELTQFCVSPVCSPTRASLMTGRCNYRTGAIDTFLGRAMMYPDEVTLAEMLAGAGYRTGIFGKWHLGDNYPLRAMDQGFQDCLVHKGGGICQPSDPPGGSSYFDPYLYHNGKEGRYEGYCTDIFTEAAMQFIEKNRDRPFFAYLATNAPHTPLQIDDRYVAPYRDLGLDDTTAKVYGMITNIDENVGRLLDKLKDLRLERDTIVIFLTDNGPQQQRYTAGLRGTKGTVYEGGLHVPCFVRWAGALPAGRKVDRLAAHLDLVPTLLEACGVAKPAGLLLDGASLLPLLRGDRVEWPDRTLYFQWHRGDVPELYRSCAARSQRYKLVNGKELYDLVADPGEQHDIGAQHPDLVAQMRAGYQAWFRDVSSTRGYDPPRIYLGTRHEDPVILTRQDWRGAQGWGDNDLGYWEVEVRRVGNYAVTLRFPTTRAAGEAHFRLGEVALSQQLAPGTSECAFDSVHLRPGPARLEAWIARNGNPVGVSYVEVNRLRSGDHNPGPQALAAPLSPRPARPRPSPQRLR